MNTYQRIGVGLGSVLGVAIWGLIVVSALLLARRAAADEVAVSAVRPVVAAIEIDRAQLRVDLNEHLKSIGDSLRDALAQGRKSSTAAEIEVASVGVRAGG
jgi:hypothetical protein